MVVSCSPTALYGSRSFHVVAPQIWNTLPSHLKNRNISREQFKLALKTWLFVQAYSHTGVTSENFRLNDPLQILDLIS